MYVPYLLLTDKLSIKLNTFKLWFHYETLRVYFCSIDLINNHVGSNTACKEDSIN